VAEREASGDFDYSSDDPADVDGLMRHDQIPEAAPAEELDHPRNDPDDDLWDEPDDSFWDNQPDPNDNGDFDGHFDAFNMTTWGFTPPPTPWYRTKPAVTATIAASVAMAAIVVSAVLLVFRGQGSLLDGGTSSVTPTAPTSADPVQVATSAAPPPPLPPPPPPPATASPVNTAPAYNPTPQPRPTKAPEINVTRLPMSVAPQSRIPRFGNH
jgi:hypothetical protein